MPRRSQRRVRESAPSIGRWWKAAFSFEPVCSSTWAGSQKGTPWTKRWRPLDDEGRLVFWWMAAATSPPATRRLGRTLGAWGSHRWRPDGAPAWVVPLVNHAIATSGDAWQSVEIDGQRYSHLINPKTGAAVKGRHSATVYARHGMVADGWASALCVLGPDGLSQLKKEQPGAAAILTTLDGEGKPKQSPNRAFRQLATSLAQPIERGDGKDSRGDGR